MKLLYFTLVLIALAAFAVLFLRHKKESPSSSATLQSFTPDKANDKVIVVKGWNEKELGKIIHDFNEIYKNDGYPPYTIQFLKQDQNLYALGFPQDIHPVLFTFLINYLAYPFNFDLAKHSILVGGQTTLNSSFEGVDASLFGQIAILYIPENDIDKDTVYMRTQSGRTLSNSFTELNWRRVDDARLSNDVKTLLGRMGGK